MRGFSRRAWAGTVGILAVLITGVTTMPGGEALAASSVALAPGASPAVSAGVWQDAQQVAGSLNTGGSASLVSLSCTSAGNCAGGGSYQVTGSYNSHAFVVSETAGHWTAAQEVAAGLNADSSAGVTSVSCTLTGNCAAGGYYADGSGHTQAFVVTEVNGTWGSAQQAPGTGALNAGGNATILAVSCSTAGNCAAGGYYTDGSKTVQAFVIDEINGTWGSAQQVPGSAALNAGGTAHVTTVSCVSPGNCAAGGYYTDGSLATQAFVADETKGIWGSAGQVPGSAALNTAGTAGITSVSCPAAGACAAGGYYTGGSGEQAMVTTEANGTWGDASQIPGLAGLNKGGSAAVTALSCPATGACGATGFYTDGAKRSQAFVAGAAGGSWGTAREIPGTGTLNSGGHAAAYSISCPAAGNCAAGGYYTDKSSAFQAFVADEAGGTWGSAEQVPGSAALNSGGRATVYSVSCPAAATCGAGGYYSSGPGMLQAFGVSEHPAAGTTTTLRLSAGRLTFGHEQAERFSVAVTPRAATGRVAVFAPLGPGRTRRLCLVTLSGGTGSCRPGARALGAGQYRVRATYLGGASLRRSTSGTGDLRIGRAATRTILRLPAGTLSFGREHSGVFSVRILPRYSGTPGGEVAIFARAAGRRPLRVCQIRLRQGRGSCRPAARALGRGRYLITARYRGSGNFTASASARLSLLIR